jgi:hypothetical protein
MMRTSQSLSALRKLCLGGALALLAVHASAAGRDQISAESSADGLEKISIKGIDFAYARPGASLVGYKKIMLDPIEVAFRKDWRPNRSGSNLPLPAKEREEIRQGVAKIVLEEFTKELQRSTQYQLVTTAGPDVLRAKARIVDLYVNAPDTASTSVTRTYTLSTGEMTLLGELFDSETGQVVARVLDRTESRGTGRFMLTNSVVNDMESRLTASTWAKILRTRLDSAHSIDGK